jgi:hypothetical protein
MTAVVIIGRDGSGHRPQTTKGWPVHHLALGRRLGALVLT